MKISTLGELEIWSKVDQEIADILHNANIGRKNASLKLAEKNFEVSEKLIRTYRSRHVPNVATPVSHLPGYTPEMPVYYPTAPLVAPGAATPYPNIIYPTNVHMTTTDTTPVIKQGKAVSSKTIVVMPDVQAPLHDTVLVNKFIKFLGDFQPTELAQVGDFTDSTEISRWVRGMKEEYAGDLQQGFDASIDILKRIREVFDGRFRIVRSNHDDRLELYIQKCAPGLASLRNLTIEKLVEFDTYEVEFIRDGMVELTDDWIMGHGDEGSLSPQAGKTAFGLAKNKFGTNVVCGHTHRAGITAESYGYNGKLTRTLTGMEVGHFMDMRTAHYLAKKGGSANWQQAFGILEIVNGKTFPRLVHVYDGDFSVDGKAY